MAHQKKEKSFSLKDQLFNKDKVTYLATQIKKAHPRFAKEKFIKETLTQFPQLELKERIDHIAKVLKTHLPKDYPKALNIILKSLPPELDPKKTDDDFGDFIIAPLSHFIAQYGCDKKNYKLSINALFEITKRFSAEDAIRYFINAFPEQTYTAIKKLTTSKNYHQRRLASEGSRISLPWSKKIPWQPEDLIPILDNLYTDPTRYVTRSVANSLNDISKVNPTLVIQTLKKWQKSKKQNPKEMDFITRHSLRTLLKQGNNQALKMLGFGATNHIQLNKWSCPKKVKIGQTTNFSFSLSTKKEQLGKLRLEYAIHFRKAKGELKPKVFKIKEGDFAEKSTQVEKKHSFQLTTTRTLYVGEHKITIILNGKEIISDSFSLQA